MYTSWPSYLSTCPSLWQPATLHWFPCITPSSSSLVLPLLSASQQPVFKWLNTLYFTCSKQAATLTCLLLRQWLLSGLNNGLGIILYAYAWILEMYIALLLIKTFMSSQETTPVVKRGTNALYVGVSAVENFQKITANLMITQCNQCWSEIFSKMFQCSHFVCA